MTIQPGKPLPRRTGLRRTPLPRRSTRLQARMRATKRRAKVSTGPTTTQRRVVAERAGYCCELCGARLHHYGVGWTEPHSFHHRQPRGMGGTSRVDVNAAYQLLLLCGTGTTGCHGDVESDRTTAYANGWLVRAAGDPATIPVLVRGRLLVLTEDGTYEETP